MTIHIFSVWCAVIRQIAAAYGLLLCFMAHAHSEFDAAKISCIVTNPMDPKTEAQCGITIRIANLKYVYDRPIGFGCTGSFKNGANAILDMDIQYDPNEGRGGDHISFVVYGMGINEKDSLPWRQYISTGKSQKLAHARKRRSLWRFNLLIISIVFGAFVLPFGTDVVAQVVSLPSTKGENIKSVGPCNLRIASIFGGKFIVSDPNGSPPQQGVYDVPDTAPNAPRGVRSFGLFCVTASEENIGTMLGAKQVDGKWLAYNPWPGPDEPELSPFGQGAHARTVAFKGANWSGTGLTVDATTGDESRRARTYYFCLVHQTHALCGNTPVQWLADPRRRNELWKVKAILQSVEFVD